MRAESSNYRRDSVQKENQVTSEPNINTRSQTDLDLVKRAQEGDADAFASLFYAHKARIYSVCLRMTNNTAEAEDLTQDAFLQVFRKLETFRGDSALSTWLYRIAVNTVLMHFRKKALKQVSLDEPYSQDAKQVRREYGSKDGRLSGSVDRIALTRAIKELPDGYRTIFLLHEVEGYEHQEIAQLLDCSVGNSKSQLHKAKLRIRELLGHASVPKVTRAPESSSTVSKDVAPDVAFDNWTEEIASDLSVQPAAMIPAMSQLVATNV
jgi:RNA polymerase sigma-70 factor, ECF subfamily